jgi:hypothetical protein
MKRIWKHKTISPCIKTFCWRLIRRALATGQRAGSLSPKIQNECSLYNMPENDAHMFFHYDFARVVWFSATPPIITSNLPQEQDGVQETLSAIITMNTGEEELPKIITLWFIWKARNDACFNNKKWSVLQVHHSTAVEITTSISELNADKQGNELQERRERRTLEDLDPNHFRITLPASLSGTRCYTDASITPDNDENPVRHAGLGILIVNAYAGTPSTIYINAKMMNCGSVIMAEAAALDLAAQILKKLGIQHPSVLTDNEQLAIFFNGQNYQNPPRWEIKPHTQSFINSCLSRGRKVYKICRSNNTTAHLLANQARQCSRHSAEFNCTNSQHVNNCPLRTALNSVLGAHFTLLAVSCC